MNGWISVKDGMPDLTKWEYASKECIVTYKVGTSGSRTTAMNYVRKIVRGKTVERWEWHEIISPWDVTDWMPMPKPATEAST